MTKTKQLPCVKFYEEFHAQNAALLGECVKEGCDKELAAFHAKITDLSVWLKALEGQRETEIYKNAFKEYEFALFCLVQGFYRQAFSSLRLFMELTLAGIQLSANEFDMRLWFAGKKDTNWNAILDLDKGVFAKNFVEAFCSELIEESKHIRSTSEKLYRECSEYVHGNHAASLTLPEGVAFSKPSFLLWSEKAKSTFLVIHYALSVRYIKELKKDFFEKIEPVLNDEIGHIKGFEFIFNKVKK
jgi:hypothetical protein